MTGVYIKEERHEPHPVYRLWQQARDAALARDRIPAVAVSGADWPGRLFVVHEADLADLAASLEASERAR